MEGVASILERRTAPLMASFFAEQERVDNDHQVMTGSPLRDYNTSLTMAMSLVLHIQIQEPKSINCEG